MLSRGSMSKLGMTYIRQTVSSTTATETQRTVARHLLNGTHYFSRAQRSGINDFINATSITVCICCWYVHQCLHPANTHTAFNQSINQASKQASRQPIQSLNYTLKCWEGQLIYSNSISAGINIDNHHQPEGNSYITALPAKKIRWIYIRTR